MQLNQSIIKFVFACTLLSPFVGPAGQAQTNGEKAVTVQIGPWEGERCFSKISPELRLSGAPAGAVQARIIVTDLMLITFDHGGGKTAIAPSPDGIAVIPAGGVPNYKGPCPEKDRSNPVHNYEFRVILFNAQGETIGRGAAASIFDPSNADGRYAGRRK